MAAINVPPPAEGGILKPYRHALACVDLAPTDDLIVTAAKRLIGQGGEVTPLTVTEPISHLVSGLDTIREANFEAKLEDVTRRSLRQLCRRNELPEHGARVIEGHPGTTIAQYAAQHHVDLIAVGAHERHGLEYLLGTVASAVLHTASCDVLGVRLSNPRRRYRRIAAAVDPKADCGPLLGRAKALGSPARLHFITVIKSPFADFAIQPTAVDTKRLLGEIEQGQHAATLSWLKQAGIESEVTVVHGTPSKQIKRFAQRNDIDLLIMGSGKSTGVAWMIGSTTHNVLHDAPCDTLVVRSPEH